MTDKKTDRRVLRTRRLLRESLLSLILEEGFDNVTIEEITDRADVGRTTFYLHYRDKEDLLFECINETVDELIAKVSGIPPSAWGISVGSTTYDLTPQNPILQIFLHVTENSDLYRIIMRGVGTGQSQNRVRDIIASAVSTFLQDKVGIKSISMDPVIPLEVFANYFAGSLLGLIAWWLETDTKYSPEEMTEIFQKLFFPGARDALDISIY